MSNWTPTILRQLAMVVSGAQQDLEDEIEAAFYPGRSVHVTWGDNETPATVVRTMWDRVEVRSIHGRQYQVCAERLVEFGERTP